MYIPRGVGDFSIDALDPSTFSLEPNPFAPLPDALPTTDLMSFLGMSPPKAPIVGPAPGSFGAWLQKNSTLAIGGLAAVAVALIASGRRR